MNDPVIEEEARLVAQLEDMVKDGAAAAELLGQLASALFPDGGDRKRMTWPDVSDEKPDAANDPRASAEARLRAAEARYRTLVEQIPAVTFMAVLGEGKNEVYVSPHIQTMLGFSQEEWLENPFLWYRQLHPDDRALWNAEFARGCRAGGPFRAECRFIARDGHIVWVHGEARVIRDESGRPAYLQGIAFDITDSKRAQEVLVDHAVRTAKAEEELAIAHRLQGSLLPGDVRVPHLELEARMIPASDVGGDYYDVIPFQGGDGAWLAIGDVAGHGIDAGLLMLMVQSSIATVTRCKPDARPSEVLCLVNEVMFAHIRSRLGKPVFVTLSLCRFDPSGKIVFAGAHLDIFVARRASGGIECIETPGTWVGTDADISSVTVDSELRLQDGDVIVLFTDGVTEAMNAKGKMFGHERLAALLADVYERPCAEIRDHILGAAMKWMVTQEDDMTVLVARYHAPDRGAG